MKKISLFLGVLVCALSFGLLLGCDTTTGDDSSSDSWESITSVSQLGGTWVGEYSDTVSVREAFEMAGEEWDPSYDAVVGNMTVSVVYQIATAINGSTGAQDVEIEYKMTFKGGNIDTLWPLMKSELEGEGFTTNDADHSATMSETENRTLTNEDLTRVSLKISKDGRKIKLPAGAIGGGSPAMTLIKQ